MQARHSIKGQGTHQNMRAVEHRSQSMAPEIQGPKSKCCAGLDFVCREEMLLDGNVVSIAAPAWPTLMGFEGLMTTSLAGMVAHTAEHQMQK